MNKSALLVSALLLCSIQATANDDIKALKDRVDALSKEVSTLKKNTGGDNVKFSLDLRTAYDNIGYETQKGHKPNNNILSNRLIVGMVAQPKENLTFHGSIVANKLFGHNNPMAQNGFNNYDWFASVTPDDGTLRLKEANFVWFGNMGDIGTTFSLGRRPSIDGFPGFLRENNKKPASPNSHNINMEFDGLSYALKLDKLIPLEGMNFKICAGRGYSNANGKYNTTTFAPAYSKNSADTPNMDMIGFIWKIYDDAQYKASFNYARAFHMLGVKDMTNINKGFQDVGDMDTMSFTVEANGIGDDLEGFLSNLRVFASYAMSKTDPNDAKTTTINPATGTPMTVPLGMLGSTDKETGSSIWVGASWQCLFDETMRIGVEYNQGDKYWRSFTYGEDTLIGSKLAARGKAVEAYINKDLIGEYLSMQIRYTKIDYDYTGSDMFFGATGGAMKLKDATKMGQDPVKTAQDLRVSLRYRF